MLALLCFGGLAIGLAVPSADGGARKLNAPLPRAPGGDVVEERYTPDGARLVFRADRERDEVFELYSVPSSGGTPVKLNAPLAPDGDVEPGFLITPDGGRVVFRANRANGFAIAPIFIAPVDGSAPALELAPSAFDEPRLSFDGAYVLYHASTGLMAVRSDGSAPAIVLSPPPPASITRFDLSPRANRLVYVADQDVDEVYELYRLDIAPGAVPTKLSAPLVAGGDVGAFDISPDGATVVYTADQRTDGTFELFGVPIGGGTAILLSGSIADVGGGEIDPTSTRVVFQAGIDSLYSAPLDASTDPVNLGIFLTDFQIDPTGQRVVTRSANPFGFDSQLWSQAIDGSAAAVFIGSDPVTFRINAQGTRVAFFSFSASFGVSRLVSRPIDGGPGAVLSSHGTRDFAFSPDGRHLVFSMDLDTPGVVELYRVPADGSAAPLKLNEPLPAGGHVAGFVLHPASNAVSFRADLAIPSVFEAFQAPITGGTNVLQSGIMPNTNLLGSVSALRTANKRAVYVAHPGDPTHAQLFGVPFEGGAHARRLGGSQLVDPQRLELTPDGKRVLYLTTNTSPTGEVELFSAPTDSSSPPIRLGRDMKADGALLPFQLGPGKLVAFLSDRRTEDVRELFVAPIDGSFPAVRLSDALVAGGDVVDFAIVPGGSGIVYRADQATNEVFELYSRTSSAPPLRLNGPLVAGGDVVSYQISPDGAFVVYLADQTTDDSFELFRVPLDGSSPPVRLNNALPTSGDGGDVFEFQISPDGRRVVYFADQLVNARYELFSVPSDGSAGPVKLNNTLPGGGSVFAGFRVCLGKPAVVFRASNVGNLEPALFVAPIDGSAPAMRLVVPIGSIGAVTSFELTPDGSRVLFTGFFNRHLWSVPTDASSAPVQIDDMPTSSEIHSYRITSGGDRVVYLAAREDSAQISDRAGVRELFLARTDGSDTPRTLNDPLGALGDVAPDFALTPDGTAVLFRADDQDPDAFELYLSVIDGHVAGTAGPGD